MEQTVFRTEINKLIKNLQQFHQKEPFTHSNQFRSAIFACSNNFFGKTHKNILIFRMKIIQYLELPTIQPSIPDLIKEINVIKTIGKKLALLSEDPNHLIEQGIMTLYCDLNDIRQYCLSNNLEIGLGLTKAILDQLSSLLRQYFIYHQYQSRIEARPKGKRQSIFSLRKYESLQSVESDLNLLESLNQGLIQEIEKQIAEKSLSQLFEEQMKKEQNKMTEALEVCRICFKQISLNILEKHVIICAQKSQLELQLQGKNITIAKLQEELKRKYKESCEEMVHHKMDDDFRRICQKILNPSRKIEKKTIRRNSLLCFKSEMNFSEKLQLCIQDYLEQFPGNDTLEELLKNYKEKNLIEKRRRNLKISAHFEQNSERSGRSSEHRPEEHQKKVKKEQKPGQIYEKSRFKEQVQNNESINLGQEAASLSQTSSQKSLKDSKESEIKIKDLSKRSLSKNNDKNRQEHSQLSMVKNYASLQLIPFPQIIINPVHSKIQLKDFQVLDFLGAGAFGKVYMVRRKLTKDIYALKIIKLPENCDEKELISIKNQHQIFKKIAGDHLVKAPFLFSQHSCHMFVLQYLPGGDLRKMLNEQVYFQEEKAKFYLAEIILAIEHLHKYEIIHRDLKPENLVIDRKGHLKLTDFGLSEFQVNKKLTQSRKQEEIIANQRNMTSARSNRKRRTGITGNGTGVKKNEIKLIGTPDYIAPEIINQTSLSNYSIDWWSLGVMAYELLIGNKPFGAQTIDQVIDNISKLNIQWPEVGYEDSMVSPESKDLIDKLLNKDFMARLGAKGANEIKMHPFFEEIDWQNLKSSTPAFVHQKMTKFSDLANRKEDDKLRQQIESQIHQNNSKTNDFELQQVVRFDILRSQTIETIGQKQEQSARRLKKLNTLKQFSYQQKQNTDQMTI